MIDGPLQRMDTTHRRMAEPYQPPRDIWEVNQSVQLDEHLEAGDPRWVDTEAARGEYSRTRFCRTLGVDRAKRRLVAPDRGYYLFCGHRGCGKSTELRRIARELHHDDLYYVHGVEAYTTMRDMLHRRAASELFNEGVADYLIEHSGGHPRSLLRLLLNAFEYAEHDRFDDPSAHRAVRKMAVDYRRILRSDDYRLLATIDAGQFPVSDSGRLSNLLDNLALLEYESSWRSHPAIRTTPEYQAARQEVTASVAPAVANASLQHSAPACGTLRSATESRSARG